MRGKGPARLQNVPSYEDRALGQGQRLESDIGKDRQPAGRATGWGWGFVQGSAGGSRRARRPSQRRTCGGGGGGGGGEEACTQSSRARCRPGAAAGCRGERSLPQPAGLPQKTSPELSDHNLSVPLPLQPHLPPDLSKQGRELQTWQSPSPAEADSCQGTARAGARPSLGGGAEGEAEACCGSPLCLSRAHAEAPPTPSAQMVSVAVGTPEHP